MKTFFSERGYLLVATALLLVLFTRLFINRQPLLNAAEQDYTAGLKLNLQPGLGAEAIQRLLRQGNYLTDPRDIDLIGDSLRAKLTQNGTPDNLGAINKRAFAIRTPITWQSRIGGNDFQSRLRVSRQQIGFDSVLYNREVNNPQTYPASVGSGGGQMAGQVLDSSPEGKPLANVLVQLKQHRP
ncbi:MAG: penicillin-binding protein, partial [Cytophagaceae bacterium]